MQFLDHLRPRLIVYSRVSMWVIIGLFVVAGLFKNVPAWAETAVCNENDTTGNSSIPVTPMPIYLKYDSPPTSYQVSLCDNPPNGETVHFETSITPNGHITVNPSSFTLNNTTPQSVAVAVNPARPRNQPFTAFITHTATSEIPGFNRQIGVTAYYSPPAALRDVQVVRRGQSVAINVLTNDTDRLGQGNLTTGIVTAPQLGTATVNANQTIQYTAPTGRQSADRLTYRVIDNIGNFDNAPVRIAIVPTNVSNPVPFDVDPQQGVILSTGDISIEVPPLSGVSPDSEVVCVVGLAASVSGPLNLRPVQPSSYTGISFYIQCTVDGEPLSEATLTSPIVVTISPSNEFLAKYGLTQLSVANWNEEDWRAAGIDISLTQNPALLTINTTLLGEFSVFSTSNKRFPSIKFND